MKYHINGGPVAGGPFTLIHVEDGDDTLEFIKSLLREAFELAPPIGRGYIPQEPMTDREAQGLIGMVDLGDALGYAVHLSTYRQRRIGIELAEKSCSCDGGHSVIVLNEYLFREQNKTNESSERLLRSLGARPWTKRIRQAAQAESRRSNPELN